MSSLVHRLSRSACWRRRSLLLCLVPGVRIEIRRGGPDIAPDTLERENGPHLPVEGHKADLTRIDPHLLLQQWHPLLGINRPPQQVEDLVRSSVLKTRAIATGPSVRVRCNVGPSEPIRVP